MGSHGAFQDAVLPSSLDDYSAVKSKWVVMQHSKKNSNNLHDLASVPDFELLDANWLDNAGPVEPVGKPTKMHAPQYELVVVGGEQGIGSNAGATGPAKDGELETILNPDAEAEVARTPPPLFRDDEMESWLLATFSDPVESALDTANPTPEKRNSLGASPLRPTPGRSGGNAAAGRAGDSAKKADAESARKCSDVETPAPAHYAPRAAAKQEEYTSEAVATPLHGHSNRALSPSAQQHQLSAQRHVQQEAQFLREQQQRLAHLQQQQREEDERERLLIEQEQELRALRQMQLRHEEDMREEQCSQALQRQMHQQQQQQQLLEQQQRQEEEEQHQHQQQLQQRQQLQNQQQEQERARMLEQEEERFVEEMGPPGAREHSGATLNFAHFSRAANLYGRGLLKSSSAGGAPPRPPVAPSTGSLPHHIAAPRPLGAPTKMGSASAAKYGSALDAVRGPSSGAPGRMQGDDTHMAPRQSGDARMGQGLEAPKLIGTVGPHYPPRSRDNSGEGGSQERAHASTLTTLPGGAERRGHAEREATVSSRGAPHLGASDNHMGGGGGSVSTLGGGAMSRGATEFSGRSSGVRMMKRGRETETECTVSEGGDDPEKNKKLLSGPGCGEDSGMGGPENGAAKRARAAEVHNLSERRRRDRINERMRMLQELIPNSNKTDKASMLDEAIEYLKMLQLQLQVMSMRSGMSIPANLVPGASTGTLPSPGGSSLTQLPGGEDPHSLPLGAMGGDALGDLPSSMPGCPDLGPGLGEVRAGFGLSDLVSGYGPSLSAGMGMEREMSGMGLGMGGMSMREMMMMRAGAGAAASAGAELGGGSMPARQQLLMEMMQADLQEQQHALLQQRQHQHHQQQQHHHQQQQYLMQQQASKSASALEPGLGLGRNNPLSRAALSGLPPHVSPLGAIPKSEMLSRGPSLSAQLPSSVSMGTASYHGHYPTSLRGGVGAGAGASLPGAGLGMGSDEMPGVGSMGAMAAAAVMLEGHRQLHPSAVDPLDVYLARQQRMQQQQQLQLQQEEEHQQQQQQAAVDYQMYQAILKRQQQAP